ncbi:hypothetical protein M1O54_02010 [Dehalococcoidia bacterium]|nr:hypothetical protein [Dehalococcoidia bacterium]
MREGRTIVSEYGGFAILIANGQRPGSVIYNYTPGVVELYGWIYVLETGKYRLAIYRNNTLVGENPGVQLIGGRRYSFWNEIPFPGGTHGYWLLIEPAGAGRLCMIISTPVMVTELAKPK